MKKRKWIPVVLVLLLISCLAGSFFVARRQSLRQKGMIMEDVSETKEDSGEKRTIYGRVSEGGLASKNRIGALEKDPYFGLEKEEFQTVWNYIRAYEGRKTSILYDMLPDGMDFDYKSYFSSMEEDIAAPLVRIEGFYEYETETACVCEVTGRQRADNGEEVYDLENSFRMTFALLRDGSVMPYSEQAGMLGDPYLSSGLR